MLHFFLQNSLACVGRAHLGAGFVLLPLMRGENLSLPHKFQVSFIKCLAGIFSSLPYCSFNIAFDIRSFINGNRSRMGGLKIAYKVRSDARNRLVSNSRPATSPATMGNDNIVETREISALRAAGRVTLRVQWCQPPPRPGQQGPS